MIKIPKEVEYIIKTFELNSFEAYIVGGCVRDSILGKTPYDWDITTSALPDETIKCFKNFKIIETGLKHGTVTLVINSKFFEITTFRIDGDYTDNRRPDTVLFTPNLKEDLARRDFTINAMAYNQRVGLVDYFGGESDIKNRVIKCVGDSNLRFNEDSLRIMRALRFSSVLNFKIDLNTIESIHKNKLLLKKIAKERINIEFNKLLIGKNVRAILNDFYDVIEVFIPEIQQMIGFNQNNPYHHLDVWQHTLESICNSPNKLIYRLTMFFHDIGKPSCYTEDDNNIGHFYGHSKKSAEMAFCILKRLKYDNLTIMNVKILVLYHDYNLKASKSAVRRLLNKLGEEQARQLLEIKRADLKAHNPKYINEIEVINKVEDLINIIIEENQCFSLKDLKINGRDLIAIGIPKGKEIGVILNRLMDLVIEEKLENDHQALITEALKLYN